MTSERPRDRDDNSVSSSGLAMKKRSSRPLAEAAQRALAEADARRREADHAATRAEVGGRGGLDPVRFGDWEIKGLTSDF